MFSKGKGEKNRISMPYIGLRYDSSRVVVLGANLNNEGGLFSLHECVVHAQFSLGLGCRKIDFGNRSYGGTLFWHRMAAYASVISGRDWHLVKNEVWQGGKRLFDNEHALANVLSRIAFLELVKCFTPEKNSKPYEPMWRYCPTYFLGDELLLLQPRKILILGNTTFDKFRSSLEPLGQFLQVTSRADVSIYKCAWRNLKFLAVKIIHPCAHGGSRKKVLASLAKTLRS